MEKLFQPKSLWTEKLAVLKDSALNEKEIDGKTLAVSVARPREEGPRRNSNYGGGNRGGYGNNRGGGYGGGNRGGGYGGGRDRY